MPGEDAMARYFSCLLSTFLCLTLAAQAQDPFDSFKQFSATMVMIGVPEGNMKIYRSGNKVRVSILGDGGYSIADLDRHTMYTVTNKGMCTQSAAQGHMTPFAQDKSSVIQRSPAGTDTVDGHPCKLEMMTVTPKNGQPTKMKVWEAEDLKEFPIKVEIESSRGPIAAEYKDVSFS
jgi:hypothetical protein